MDALGDLLAPYSELIAKFAGGVTCLQFLSGIFLLNDIRRKGSSDQYPPDPFVGGVVLTLLTLKLGMLMGDMPMIRVNIIGLGINMVFLSVFYFYASNESKSKIWSKIGIAGVFILGCLAYTNFEDPKKLEFRMGMIITSLLVILVGSPLLSLGKIIETKSTAGLPFPIILSGTLVAASWALYGISIRNPPMAYQNLFLCALSSIQLSLFVIYPNSPPAKGDSLAHSPSTLEHKVSQKIRTPIPSASSIDKKAN